MNDSREASIRSLMGRFRTAAGHEATRQHVGFRYFPQNSCTWASFALGHLLAEMEPSANWHLVNAQAVDGWGGHDWLESRGLAVDVTADQFNGYEPYVGPAPAPRPERYGGPLKRIDLADMTPAQEEALGTIRGVIQGES